MFGHSVFIWQYLLEVEVENNVDEGHHNQLDQTIIESKIDIIGRPNIIPKVEWLGRADHIGKGDTGLGEDRNYHKKVGVSAIGEGGKNFFENLR